MTLEQWQAGGHTYLYRDYPLFYREDGLGEMLLCLHGFPTASWDWVRLWPTLTQHFRVIAPDMIGFGFSAKPRDYAYSLMDQADLHEHLLADLNIDAVHILAHDYGDTVAQELLARQAERMARHEPGLHIKSVCLLNGGLFPEVTRPRLTQKLLAGPFGGLVARLLTAQRFRMSFSAVFGPDTQPTAADLDQFWHLITHRNGKRVAHKISRYQRERRRHRRRWVSALQETAVPLRFINGPEDPVSGRLMAARYRELIPEPDVVLLEGIGHYPQFEAPEAVLAALLAFHAKIG